MATKANTTTETILFDVSEFCELESYGSLAVFNMSFTLLGLVSGIFLILLICKNQALRGDNFLLLNNFLFSVIFLLTINGFVYTEEAINPCFYLGNFFCKIINFIKTTLTNSSTFFLVALAFQQMNRYRQKLVTVFNSTHNRFLITMCVIWFFAAIVSIPELVLAKVLVFDPDGILSVCDVFQESYDRGNTIKAKILFVEYLSPFLFLLIIVVVTGIYVYLVKSQYTTWGVTTGESLVARDVKYPTHFGLLVALTIVFILGYFPLYSFQLAHYLEGIAQTGKFNRFWLHMDLVSTFFVILPSSLTPLFIMMFSWVHRDVVKAVYSNLTVNIFEGQPDREQNENKD